MRFFLPRWQASVVASRVTAHCGVCSPQRSRLEARSRGGSTCKKMCLQADLDTTGALRHMNKNNSARPVCRTHPLAPISTSFLFVFDTEWVMSTCEHQGRDTVLQTGLKLHWKQFHFWRNKKSRQREGSSRTTHRSLRVVFIHVSKCTCSIKNGLNAHFHGCAGPP